MKGGDVEGSNNNYDYNPGNQEQEDGEEEEQHTTIKTNSTQRVQ